MIVDDLFESGPFSYGAKKPRKGSVVDLAAQKRKEQEHGKQPAEPRDQRVGVARVVKDVAEGISVVDQDYDLDQMHLTLDIEGKKVSFTYWDYEEDFSNAERRDVFDQLQEQPWYKGLDHPTKMEILDAAYRAIRGLEPQEYRPTVGDEPLDEQGVAEGSQNQVPWEAVVNAIVYDQFDTLMNRYGLSFDDIEYIVRQHGFRSSDDVKAEYGQGVAEGSLDDIEDTKQLKGAISLAKTQKAIRQAKDGKDAKYYADGTKVTPAEVARRAAERKAKKQGVSEGTQVLKLNDYDQWLDKVDAIGAEKHVQKNRTTIIAQTWDGENIGEFDLRSNQGWVMSQGVAEGSAQEKLYKRHQELRKKSGLPDAEYYQELKQTYTLPDAERLAKQAEIKRRYGVKEQRMQCPECGGAAYEDRVLAEKNDACYHKVKSRYKVWPSAYASGALVRCRKVGAANWGNKSKK